MTGKEKFIDGKKDLGFTMLDFWSKKYSSIHNLKYVIAEFLIEKALGIDKTENDDSWTLYDINYNGKRIEVKESAYYHPWNNKKENPMSDKKTFGITKAYTKYKDSTSKFERQNDVYVFCLNTGKTEEESDPLNIEHWEFYIIPTHIINEKCGNGKTITLGKVRKLAKSKVEYCDIKNYIDELILKKEI